MFCDVKYCPQCKQLLSISLFGKQSSAKDGLRRICKSCRHVEYLACRDDILQKNYSAYHAQSADEHRDFLDRQSVYRSSRSARERQFGMCSKCLSRPSEIGSHCKTCHEYIKRWSDTLRDQILSSYGGVCAICGESYPAFLAIDHINDDGSEHRRITGNGHRLYRWLRNNSFPSGYQVLCHNHNWLKYVCDITTDTYIKFWRATLRHDTITAYGGKCVCCGESQIDVLTIDHINGGGNEHRRMIGYSGSPFYSWLRKNGFPQEGFQLLCFNCNRAKFYYGMCPHQS